MRDVPAYDVQTIESFYDARLTAIGHVITRLVGGIGLMGMTLTVVGLYGLVSYAVSRRTREIGIRIAIGASAGRVLGMILRQGMTPAWFGVPAGLAAERGDGPAAAAARAVHLPHRTVDLSRRGADAAGGHAVCGVRARAPGGARRSDGRAAV